MNTKSIPDQNKVETIKKVINDYGVSAEHLARLSGIYPEHLRKILRGERILSWKSVNKLAPVLAKYNTII